MGLKRKKGKERSEEREGKVKKEESEEGIVCVKVVPRYIMGKV